MTSFHKGSAYLKIEKVEFMKMSKRRESNRSLEILLSIQGYQMIEDLVSKETVCCVSGKVKY